MALTLKNVLIVDEVDDKCVKILQNNGIEVTKNTKLSKEELLKEIVNYEGVIVRSASKITEPVVAAGKKLKIIGRAGTGVDNIDVPAATKNGVIVMNTPGGNTMSAAEHTCAMMLAASRNIANGTESLRAGRWDRKKFMGNEVYGKTLAIIGLGRIGKEVALRMQSFGMTTIGFDPIISAEEAAEFNTEWLQLSEIWPRADYVTFHVPLIPPTKHMLNDTTFAQCKDGIRVINVARGGIVDEEALLRALESGKCAGAALDVFVQEPPSNLDLVKHPKVTSTPHLGASTLEAQTRVAEEIAQQFVDMAQGKSLFGALNAQALSCALSESTRPWVQLCTALGILGESLLGSVSDKTSIKIITQGDGLKGADSYLGAALFVGLLHSKGTDAPLNLVNGPALAKSLGLTVKYEHVAVTTDKPAAMVTVELQAAGGPAFSLSGLTAAGRPILATVNTMSFPTGAVLSGELIVYKGKAEPATLAAVIGAVSEEKSAVHNFSSSMPSGGENWNVLRVSPPLNNIDALKAQTSFLCTLSL